MPIPSLVKEYRVKIRKRHDQALYSGLAHFAFTASVALSGIILALCQVKNLSWKDMLIVPITFAYANLVEYLAHRGPMHHRTRGLGLIFTRHTVEHHHFFTHQAMAVERTRDYKIVLFPALLIVFFFGFFASPVGLLAYRLISPNAGYLFVATALGYFLNYECFHLIYHLNDDHFVTRLPGVGILRGHHARHHDPVLMSRFNFNITWPLCDLLFRTYR
ncbi:MAG: fatty acid hydroxylase family protein [Deltaproteobacteria bacterium]|nr:fatty acid hydroxylase family protein [Deltaproteobacteria bacterium]